MRREVRLIGLIVIAAVVLGTALYLIALGSFQGGLLGSSKPTATTTVPFTVVVQGPSAYSVQKPTNYRITSKSDLASLWPLIYGTSGPKPPGVNFSRYELLAVFDGKHTLQDYNVQVLSVVDTPTVRTITLLHVAPGSSCSRVAASVSPYEVIQVPKTDLPLTHIDTASTTSCK